MRKAFSFNTPRKVSQSVRSTSTLLHRFVKSLPSFAQHPAVLSVKPVQDTHGPVVWGVAVCVGVGMRFCKVPVDGHEFSRQGEVVQMAESQ